MSFAIRKPGYGQHYLDEGSGVPVVLVHGWPLNLEMWAPQASVLRNRWRVIRMDRRGFGSTGGKTSVDDDVGDLIALIEYLNLRDVTLVGMSQGARVAMRASPHLRKRLRSLVLDGAPADEAGASPPEAELPFSRYRQLIASQGMAAFRAELQAHPLMRLHAANPAASSLLQDILDHYDARELIEPESPARTVEFSPVCAAEIALPTLVLNGELDTNRRRMGDALFAALPFGERSIIAAAGHLPNLDRPREYNEVLSRFIERQGRTIT